jgi:hypothetical protein
MSKKKMPQGKTVLEVKNQQGTLRIVVDSDGEYFAFNHINGIMLGDPLFLTADALKSIQSLKI